MLSYNYREKQKCADLQGNAQNSAVLTLKTLTKRLHALPIPFKLRPFAGLPANVRNCRKSGKQIERCVISTFQIAESMGFKGDFRQWEDLLRVGE
jgi:hypothetical protein